MKPPKFLIAHNEAAQPGAAFIVHTQDPSFVAQILTFSNEEEMQLFEAQHECIRVNDQVLVHVQEYLKSEDFRRIEWLKKKVKHWMNDYVSNK